MKLKDETLNEYAMRLRVLAKHCNYGVQMKKEIERQFVVSYGMVEVEKECVRTDDLDLTKVLVMASGYERSASNMKVLRKQAEFTNRINYTSGRDWNNIRSYEESSKAGGHSNDNGNGSGGSNSKCKKCGRYEHRPGVKCLAEKSECYKCKQIGHY